MYPKPTIPLTTMIGRINKTLNFANQVIPLYVKAKPMIKNAKEAFKVAKVFIEKPNPKKEPEKIIQPKPIISSNKPIFFQ